MSSTKATANDSAKPHPASSSSSSKPTNPTITTVTTAANRIVSPTTMTSPIPSATSINILPSNQAAVISSPTSIATGTSHRPSLSNRTSSQSLHYDASTAGPIRHPRPMTAAQLHSELEQENEAVVNRLTRELSLLRAAQNASVVSNASSNSTHADADHYHPISPVYPIAIPAGSANSRRHARTASNTSVRSTAAATISSSYEARWGIPLSRQGSSASRRSRTDSPGPHGITAPADSTLGYLQQQRNPAPTSIPLMSAAGSLPDAISSPSLIAGTPRYEETAFYRAELESAKRENDALKRRIRELERLIRDRRPSDFHPVTIPTPSTSRPRSESVSTTASINPTVGSGANIAPPRDAMSGIATAHHTAHAQGHVPAPVLTGVTTTGGAASATSTQPPTPSRGSMERAGSVTGSIAVGVPEEEVKVGESAANGGISGVVSPMGTGTGGKEKEKEKEDK